jgi:hypothetical protein
MYNSSKREKLQLPSFQIKQLELVQNVLGAPEPGSSCPRCPNSVGTAGRPFLQELHFESRAFFT